MERKGIQFLYTGDRIVYLREAMIKVTQTIRIQQGSRKYPEISNIHIHKE